MSYFINRVIQFSLGLNQSDTKRCRGLKLYEDILFAFESERDICVNVIQKGGIRYIIFRGSRLGNWYDNLRVKQHKIPYHLMKKGSRIRVHTGFIDAYKSVRLPLMKFLIDEILMYGNKDIIVGGHSLGGALATLCALDLQYKNPDIDIECVTLGSPRVGNWWFYKSYNKRVPKTVRIVHGNDIVTRLPPAWLFYKHVGKRLHQGNKWKFWLLPWGSIRDHLAYEVF